MKLLRVSASLLAFSTVAVLTACGGGGGGGSVTPPSGPGGPPPVTQPTGAPTGAPTSTPTAVPTATPTAAPTASPVPASVGVNTSLTLRASEDFINGDRTWYTSGTASWSPNSGGTSSAPTTSADGMSCTKTQEPAASTTTYSQHAFVGIYFNGKEESLPQALGMVNPQPPTTPYAGNPSGHKYNTDAVEIEDCEFNVHTHDYSGLVHVEDVNQPQSNVTVMPYATLQTLFDVWGAQLGATGITAGSSSLPGAVQIYVGTPSTKNSSGDDLVNSYTLATGGANTIQLGHHTAVWIVVGQPPQDGLPQVAFGIQY